MYIQLHEILPGQTVNVQVTIQMESCAELFDHCYWQADLYLRDKFIEYNFEKVRITPFYIPRDPPGDILMVTSKSVTRKEFVYWQHIFEMLNVSVDFWDTTRYCGFSVDSRTSTRHQVTWEGKYNGRMILYPHCNFDLLLGVDIASHFHGTDYQGSTLEELHSSMILFLPESKVRGPAANKFADRGDLCILRHLSLVESTLDGPENSYGGKHMLKPSITSKPHLKWEKKHLKKMEKELPAQASVVLNRQINIQSTGIFSYVYGSVDINRVPILRSSKFLCMDGAGGNVVNMSLDDVHLVPSSSQIPLASNYGQVFLATLYGLPMYCKIKLLQGKSEQVPQEQSIPVSFLLPGGVSLSVAEVVMITASFEIADELYSCSGSAERIEQLSESIQQDSASFVSNGRVIFRGLKLIKEEVNKRKKRVSNAPFSQAVHQINHHINSIERTLKHAGVNHSNLDILIPLEYLMNNERVHRSHQHWVKDKQWNLIGE